MPGECTRVLDMNIILEGVVGSVCYNLNTAESDEDKLGVFQAPTNDILSLGWNQHKESVVQHEPDATYHELKKFIGLVLRANPTVTELLWLNEYTIRSLAGNTLVDNREQLLSQRVRSSYGGYAKQQMYRLCQRGNFSSATRNRTAKHGRHLWRLTLQLETILSTGNLQVRLTDEQREECFDAGNLAVDDHLLLKEKFDKKLAELDSMASDLRQEPDEDAANDILIYLRNNCG